MPACSLTIPRKMLATTLSALLLAGCGGSGQEQGAADQGPAPQAIAAQPDTIEGYHPYGHPSLVSDKAPVDEIDPIERLAELVAAGIEQVPAKVQTKDVPMVIAANADTVGAWSAARNWPLIAIHVAMLPDGRVMSYGTTAEGKQTGKFIYDIWESAAARIDLGHLTLPNTTNTDIFCSSQTLLPLTGQLLITGGDNYVNNRTTNTGNQNSNVFSPAGNTLSPGANMNRARWYSSVTTLPDARQYVQGGTGGTDYPEVRELDGRFSLLSQAPSSELSYYYPKNFVAQDGRVFGFDSSGRLYFADPVGDGYLDRLTNLGSQFVGTGSATAMFAPGQILQVAANNNRAVRIDINGPLPVVTEVSNHSGSRNQGAATVLPDGKVLVTGGSTLYNEISGANYVAEIYDPQTNTWTQGARGTNSRLYHSNALLLPDATVLVAGGGAPGPQVNTNAEIYYPPYLFGPNGSYAPRPVIASAPQTVSPGSRHAIGLAGSPTIGSVVLIRTGSSTHSVNFDQRRIPLDYQQYGSNVNIALPANGAIVPPGFYYLFVLDDQGVPSIARIIKMTVGDPFRIGAGWTGRYGGTGGNEFRLECAADEVLVGVHGAANTIVNQVGPQCVRTTAQGAWIGNPVNRASVGASAGTAFTRTCPAGSAVSGMSARTGSLLDRLTLSCRPLAGPGRITGTRTDLPAIGGTGGTARRDRSCGNEQPAFALYGRAGTQVNAFGLLCRGDEAPANRPPSLPSPGNRTQVVGTPLELALQGADPDQDPLRYSVVGLPAGLALDTDNGRITGSPTEEGGNTVTFTVSDGFFQQSVTVNWTIEPVPLDTDGDGLPDATDPDDDNDGVPDEQDAFPLDATESVDTDGDGIGNGSDADDDGDGVADIDDADPLDPAIGAIDLAARVTGLQTQAALVNTANTVTTLVNGELAGASYQWTFGDGNTASTTVPEVDHTWTAPGRYQVRVTVSRGSLAVTRTVWQAVHAQLTTRLPRHSSPVIYRSVGNGGDQVWNVNPDQGTITLLDPATATRLAEVPVGTNPRSLAIDSQGRLYVVNKDSADITLIDAATRAPLGRIALPVGSRPHGIVIDDAAGKAWVVLEARASVIAVDLATATLGVEIALGENPRHLALNADGSRLLVARFITAPVIGESTRTPGNGPGGTVWVVDTQANTLLAPAVLAHDIGPDTAESARGVPNYLMAPVISPDGLSAFVPFKSDNIFRGTMRDGQAREHDRLVRGKLARLALADGTAVEQFARRIDFENNSPATAAALGPNGNYLYVVHEASRFMEVLDAWSGGILATVFLDFAPQGIAVSPDGTRVFVYNFLGRSMSVLDATGLMAGSDSTVSLIATVALTTGERLPAQVLQGKRLFHDGQDARLVSQSYFSCASCHDDGGHDGRTWDMSDVGEGLRNTIDLRGRAGMAHGNVHWTGNFDEIHDFENDIRAVFKGTGLLSDVQFAASADPLGAAKAGRSADLDALAAYVATFTSVGTSPYRTAGGALSTDATAGRQLFIDTGCASCHAGTGFTDSPAGAFHDIGTVDDETGGRLGGALVDGGLDTPTLRGLWLNAPYLHDGSAATVQAAIRAHTAGAVGTRITALSDSQVDRLAAYLLSIDDAITAAPLLDTDGDGLPDATDPDDDDDGVPDGADAFPLDATETLDTDGDGLGNNADEDDDGDGVPDVSDLDPLDPTIGAGNDACNKLPNGHFETGVADWYSNTTMTRITEAAVGTGALRFSGGWVSNIFAVAPGSVYRFSGAYRNTGTVGWTGYGLDIVDANGDEIGERVRTLDPAAPWTRFTVDVTVPANGAYLRPWFSAEPERTLSIDDLDLRLLGCTDGGIGDNQAPTVANPGEQFAQVGATILLPIVASDPEGAPLSFDAVGLPAGLSLDVDTGLITGSPTTAGVQAVTVSASDGVKSAAVQFSWTVQAQGDTTVCNRLLDGDFENGLGNWVSNANPSRTSQARTGTGAMQFTNGWISVELPVVAGTSQTFNGHYRSASGAGWAGYGFDWVDATGIEIAEEVRTLAPSADWSPLTLTAVAPAGATSLKVWFYADPDRTMGLDDLDLRTTGCTGGGAANCNRVDNPGFEQGVGGWQSSTTPLAVADAAVGGQAARLSGGWMTTGTVATPGQGYAAQALYKASGSDGWAGFGLKFIDDDYRTLAEVPVTLEFAANWSRTSTTAVAPPGTTRAQVWFYADPGRTLTVDEVDLRLTSCQ